MKDHAIVALWISSKVISLRKGKDPEGHFDAMGGVNATREMQGEHLPPTYDC